MFPNWAFLIVLIGETEISIFLPTFTLVGANYTPDGYTISENCARFYIGGTLSLTTYNSSGYIADAEL